MTNKSKKLALVGLVAASYAVITIVGLPVFKMVNNKYGNRIKNFNMK